MSEQVVLSPSAFSCSSSSSSSEDTRRRTEDIFAHILNNARLVNGDESSYKLKTGKREDEKKIISFHLSSPSWLSRFSAGSELAVPQENWRELLSRE